MAQVPKRLKRFVAWVNTRHEPRKVVIYAPSMGDAFVVAKTYFEQKPDGLQRQAESWAMSEASR